MKLLMIGCEYAGTTTLADALKEWFAETMGANIRIIHDHFKIPDNKPHGDALTEEEIQQLQALSPRVMEVVQRHNIYYHTPQGPSGGSGSGITIGLHFDDLVYGPLYWGYGKPGSIGDRRVIAKHIEHSVMKWAPDTVLVLMKATPDVIIRRMREAPHPYPVVQGKDVEHVLQRFEEEAWASLLGRRITLDTSTATVEQTVADFAGQALSLLTDEDRTAMLLFQSRVRQG